MLDRPLTHRERDVLRLVGAGKTSAQIAVELGVAACTVDSHVATAMARLGARTRRHAALLAQGPTASEATNLRREEREVLGLLAEGLTLDQAAQTLHYSRRTVARRIARARAALRVATTAEALVAAGAAPRRA
jgi:DNA-binding CsgD family transcriptional regulator